MDTLHVYITGKPIKRTLDKLDKIRGSRYEFPYQIKPVDDHVAIVYILRDSCNRDMLLKTLISRFINQDKYIRMDDGTIWWVQAQSRIAEKVKDQDTIDKVSIEFDKIAVMV